MIYLASPFWHTDPVIRNHRVEVSRIITKQMLTGGEMIYSPLVFSIPVDDHSITEAIWMEHCLDMLMRCDELLIVPLSGWHESRGISREIEAWQSDRSRPGIEFVNFQLFGISE